MATIQGVYVALFGRPADPLGLAYWKGVTNDGADLSKIGDLAQTKEYQDRFVGQSNAQVVNSIYQTLFGRDADVAGLTFWVNGLQSGQFTINDIAIRILDGAQGSDKTRIDTKVAAADAFTASIDTAKEIVAYDGNAAAAQGRAFLAGVTDTAPTQEQIDAAIQNVITGGGDSTFNLTINQDSLVGTAANDTFNALATQNGAGALIDTLQSVDVIDGGDGVDVLNVTLATGTPVNATIKNVEQINVRNTINTADLSLASVTGLEKVTVADSTAAGTLTDIGGLASLAIRNQASGLNIAGVAGSATTLALALDTVGTATTAAVLDLGVTNASKVTTANITANNAYVTVNSTKADVITTASIAATGANALTFTDSAATLTTATITGAGSVDLTGAALSALTSLDASASTGAIKAEITTAAKAVTVKTGAGNDVIDVDAVATTKSSVSLGAGNDTVYVGGKLANFDKGLDGGDGTDIISITDGATLTATTAKYITNFETLDVSGGKGNYDVSLNSFATVQINEAIAGALAGAVDFKNAGDAFTLNISSKAKTDGNFAVGNTIAVTGKDYAGTTAGGDAETFTLSATIHDGNKDNTADGNINANTITVAGVEKLVISANVGTLDGGTDALKASAHTLTAKIVAAQAESLTITGDASVDLSGVSTIGVLTKVDASGSTGNVKIDLSTHAKAISYTGSDGVDTYAGSAAGSVIYTGKGADLIDLTASSGGTAVRDTFVLKAATDSQIGDSSKDGKITIAADTGFDAITKFETGGGATADRIDLTNFGFTGAQRGVEDVSALVTNATDLTNVADLFSSVAGDRGVAFSVIGTDTWIFVDANKDGNFTAADDIVVKLTGVASLSEVDVNF